MATCRLGRWHLQQLCSLLLALSILAVFLSFRSGHQLITPPQPASSAIATAAKTTTHATQTQWNTECSAIIDKLASSPSAQARDLLSAWTTFAAAEATATHEYCLTRCDLRVCCEESVRKGRTWLVVVKDDMTTRDLDVTLVTQGTLDRVSNVDLINAAWEGPKVVVFALFHAHTSASVLAEQRQAIQRAAEAWSNIVVVICDLVDTEDFYTRQFASFKRPLLPINTLRNIGVDLTHTNYVFPLDIDFIPSRQLYTKLVRAYLPLAQHIDRVAMVIPHWEALRCTGRVRMPTTFDELHTQTIRGSSRPFHVTATHLIHGQWTLGEQDVCDDDGTNNWIYGIQTSNYHDWFASSSLGHDGLFPVTVTTNPTEDRYYEPFVVVRRVEVGGFPLPRYPEQFVGRFKNKIAFVSSLRTHRYRFFTIRREFVVHAPHSVSNQSTPDMLGLLVHMRTLHREDRVFLHKHVYPADGDRAPPPRRVGGWEEGLKCSGA